MKSGISAIVVVYNQSELLEKALNSISTWVDQIILVDLESTEDIKKIADTFKAKYVPHQKVSIVEEIRQEVIGLADHEYILFLDPDETIPPDLAADLEAKITEGEYDYFVTARCNYVFGKWVKHSRWWPDLQTRVFRYNKAVWGTKLHANSQVTGTGYTFPAEEKFAIHHENYRSLDEFIEKNMRYAKADAQNRIDAKEDLTLLTATKLSVSELISRFFAGTGYKDGMHGLVLAILQSFYYFMVYAYFWEAKKYIDLESESSIQSFPRTWFSHGLSEVMHWDKAKGAMKIIKEKFVRRMIG